MSTLISNNLHPVFKWTGGKRKEIKYFCNFFPQFVLNNKNYTYVEPFIGGGAVYWHLNNINGHNIVNDFDEEVVNFYEEFKLMNFEFVEELTRIGKIIDHNQLEKEYYDKRNQDRNGGLKNLSKTQRAIRFFIVNQLAFSGMRRFNSLGEFNVPFGHYKKINTKIIESSAHQKLLNKTDILCGDFDKIIEQYDKENTFIFLDPPYTRVFKTYSSNNSFDEKDHIRLSNLLKNLRSAIFMLIIDKSELSQELYKSMIKSSYHIQYGVNIKNRFNTASEHLIITNY